MDDEFLFNKKPLRKIKNVYIGENGVMYYVKEEKKSIEDEFEIVGDPIDILERLRFNLIKKIGDGDWRLSEFTAFSVSEYL